MELIYWLPTIPLLLLLSTCSCYHRPPPPMYRPGRGGVPIQLPPPDNRRQHNRRPPAPPVYQSVMRPPPYFGQQQHQHQQQRIVFPAPPADGRHDLRSEGSIGRPQQSRPPGHFDPQHRRPPPNKPYRGQQHHQQQTYQQPQNPQRVPQQPSPMSRVPSPTPQQQPAPQQHSTPQHQSIPQHHPTQQQQIHRVQPPTLTPSPPVLSPTNRNVSDQQSPSPSPQTPHIIQLHLPPNFENSRSASIQIHLSSTTEASKQSGVTAAGTGTHRPMSLDYPGTGYWTAKVDDKAKIQEDVDNESNYAPVRHTESKVPVPAPVQHEEHRYGSESESHQQYVEERFPLQRFEPPEPFQEPSQQHRPFNPPKKPVYKSHYSKPNSKKPSKGKKKFSQPDPLYHVENEAKQPSPEEILAALGFGREPLSDADKGLASKFPWEEEQGGQEMRQDYDQGEEDRQEEYNRQPVYGEQPRVKVLIEHGPSMEPHHEYDVSHHQNQNQHHHQNPHQDPYISAESHHAPSIHQSPSHHQDQERGPSHHRHDQEEASSHHQHGPPTSFSSREDYHSQQPFYYQPEPDPIIEIIVQESNVTLPPPPPRPPTTTPVPTPEPVHVFYVRYSSGNKSQTQNGGDYGLLGQESIRLENPVSSLQQGFAQHQQIGLPQQHFQQAQPQHPNHQQQSSFLQQQPQQQHSQPQTQHPVQQHFPQPQSQQSQQQFSQPQGQQLHQQFPQLQTHQPHQQQFQQPQGQHPNPQQFLQAQSQQPGPHQINQAQHQPILLPQQYQQPDFSLPETTTFRAVIRPDQNQYESTHLKVAFDSQNGFGSTSMIDYDEKRRAGAQTGLGNGQGIGQKPNHEALFGAQHQQLSPETPLQQSPSVNQPVFSLPPVQLPSFGGQQSIASYQQGTQGSHYTGQSLPQQPQYYQQGQSHVTLPNYNPHPKPNHVTVTPSSHLPSSQYQVTPSSYFPSSQYQVNHVTPNQPQGSQQQFSHTYEQQPSQQPHIPESQPHQNQPSSTPKITHSQPTHAPPTIQTTTTTQPPPISPSAPDPIKLDEASDELDLNPVWSRWQQNAAGSQNQGQDQLVDQNSAASQVQVSSGFSYDPQQSSNQFKLSTDQKLDRQAQSSQPNYGPYYDDFAELSHYQHQQPSPHYDIQQSSMSDSYLLNPPPPPPTPATPIQGGVSPPLDLVGLHALGTQNHMELGSSVGGMSPPAGPPQFQRRQGVELPDEVPEELRRQLIEAGILDKADVEVLNLNPQLFQSLTQQQSQSSSAIQPHSDLFNGQATMSLNQDLSSLLGQRTVRRVILLNQDGGPRQKRQGVSTYLLLETNQNEFLLVDGKKRTLRVVDFLLT